MRVTEKKDGHITYHYKGDLEKEVLKCRDELEKKSNSEEVEHWKYLRDVMDKKIKSHETRLERLRSFIKLAEKKLAEEKEEKTTD